MLVDMATTPPAGSDFPPLARTVLDRLQTTYTAAADPVKAVAMRAYMRDRFPFLGIPAPLQRTLTREFLAGLDRPNEEDLRAVAGRLDPAGVTARRLRDLRLDERLRTR